MWKYLPCLGTANNSVPAVGPCSSGAGCRRAHPARPSRCISSVRLRLGPPALAAGPRPLPSDHPLQQPMRAAPWHPRPLAGSRMAPSRHATWLQRPRVAAAAPCPVGSPLAASARSSVVSRPVRMAASPSAKQLMDKKTATHVRSDPMEIWRRYGHAATGVAGCTLRASQLAT